MDNFSGEFKNMRLTDSEQHMQFFTSAYQHRINFPLYREQGRIAITIEEYRGAMLSVFKRYNKRIAAMPSSLRQRFLAELESDDVWQGGSLSYYPTTRCRCRGAQQCSNLTSWRDSVDATWFCS